MYVCMYICVYVCMYVRMYVSMYVCVWMCLYVCMYYVHTYVCALPSLYYFAVLCCWHTSCTWSVCASSLPTQPTRTLCHIRRPFPAIDTYLLRLFPECMTFYGIAGTTLILFLRLARGWPQLMVQWSTLEEAQRRYGTPRYLRIKIRCVTAALFFGASGIISNHLVLVSQVVSFHESVFDSWQAQVCAPLPNVQPGCGTPPAFYLLCTMCSLGGVNR